DRGKDPGIVSVVDVMVSRFDDAIVATDRALRASRPMRNWLGTLRWCGDSIHGTTGLTVKDRAILSESGVEAIVLLLLHATDHDGFGRHRPEVVQVPRHGESGTRYSGSTPRPQVPVCGPSTRRGRSRAWAGPPRARGSDRARRCGRPVRLALRRLAQVPGSRD